MIIKRNILMLLSAMLLSVAPVVAEEATNLIENPGFETYKATGNGEDFEPWEEKGFSAHAEKSDVVEGSTALRLYQENYSTSVYQRVSLGADSYIDGASFELIIHYKALTIPSGGNLSLDCYWEPKPGGDPEAMKTHDAAVLQRVLSDAPDAAWKRLRITTTRPKNAKGLYIGFTGTKNAVGLIDSLSLLHVESAEPYLTVTPDKLSMSTTVGNTDSKTLKIRQGNVTAETKFEMSYTDAALFKLSASSMPADLEEMDLVITYKPTAAGNHTAVLNIMNDAHSILNQSIKIEASCTDPTKKPELTVTPTSITDFQAIAGEEQKKKIHVSSINCTDFVYLKMEHVKGAAFLSGSGMLGKNGETDVDISFKPLTEGEYESKLTISTEGAESVVVTFKGKAEAKSPENIDWLVDFKWDLSAPLTLLDERFDSVEHNKTLVLKGWQNVAKLDARPWWGFDEAQTAPVRGKNRYAKASAYQFGKSSTGTWEMWLVTPALDFKNTQNKKFAFSVMCEYQPEEGSEAKLEVYYIDANISGSKDTVFFQNLTSSFDIPKVADDNLTWRTFYMDLSPYAETIADIFHMAFRYVGPNGADGAVVYDIDNVSWGTEPTEPEEPYQGIESVQNSEVRIQKVLRNGQVIIVRDGKEYSILGVRLF